MLYIDKTADSYLQFEKSFSGLGSQHKESNKYLNDHITLQTRAGAFRVLWPQTGHIILQRAQTVHQLLQTANLEAFLSITEICRSIIQLLNIS